MERQLKTMINWVLIIIGFLSIGSAFFLEQQTLLGFFGAMCIIFGVVRQVIHTPNTNSITDPSYKKHPVHTPHHHMYQQHHHESQYKSCKYCQYHCHVHYNYCPNCGKPLHF